MGVTYALFLSSRIRQSESLSIPENIRSVFGQCAGTAAAIAILVIAIPAPFMLSIGVVLQAITNWPLWICITCGTAASLTIVAKGGLRSDVAANVIQVSLMYAGFAALAIGCVARLGSPQSMLDALPSGTLDVPGSVGWSGVAVWMLIAMQTFVDPNFHMRTAAARNSTVARNGLLLSVAGWVLFDGLQLFIGLYGLAYVASGPATNQFLNVAQLALPDVWKGLFVASVLAAVMSTLDGYALASATTIGHDLLGGAWRLREYRLQLGLAITGVVGCLAAILIPSITDLIFMAASVAVPGLLLPMVFSLWPASHRILRRHGGMPSWLLIVIPASVAVVFTMLRATNIVSLEPMLAGLLSSIALAPFTHLPHVTRSRQVSHH
jgi:SSS family solute:Na+ symporter